MLTKKSKPKQISIIGCGWLGLPLAKKLMTQNHNIIGTTTSLDRINELKQANIHPILLNIPHQTETNKVLFNVDYLIITLPFKRSFNPPSIYLNQIDWILQQTQKHQTKTIIFTSSTSIYEATNKIVDETTIINPTTPRQKTLYEVEQTIMTTPNTKYLILRCAGLYGYDRQIGKFINKKSNQHPNNKVNLIHLDDILNIITKLIENNIKNEIINLVSDNHPTKVALYTKKAKEHDLPPPIFNKSVPLSYKIVSNKKIKTLLNYTFLNEI